MGVNYSKLWHLLIEKKISKPKFREMAGISPATYTKLNQDKYVSMEIMARICETLQCNIGDVMDIEHKELK